MAQQQLPVGYQPNVRVMHVLKDTVERDEGLRAQVNNITAAKTVADIVRTTLGPHSMMKMILDPAGGVVLTGDGHAILRDINVNHPAAKHMIELARAQDEECGDGTTSVVVLTGDLLAGSVELLEEKVRPVTICQGFVRALDDAVEILNSIATTVDVDDDKEVFKVVKSCLATKSTHGGDLIARMAIKAARVVHTVDAKTGRVEIDVKRYAKVEKIPGGQDADSVVLDGVMFNKDLVHPRMRRRIENPRIVLLDSPLEYKKMESAVNVEFANEEQFEEMLKVEEEFVTAQVNALLSVKPDLVITEKGVSDLAAHIFLKNGVSCIRRLRKTDTNRIARATGATIISRATEVKDHDVGTRCGLFELKKIGDETFTYLTQCREAKACTIVMRGASKDVLNDMERSFGDAVNVTRNLLLNPHIVAGGGAAEMAVSVGLTRRLPKVPIALQQSYKMVASSMEVIPRTLVQNCGKSVIRAITELRAKQASDPALFYMGVNGETGEICDTRALGVFESSLVKLQTVKTAVEAACVLLRVDGIISGVKREGESSSKAPKKTVEAEDGED